MKKHLLLTFIIIFTVISAENSMAFEIFNTKFQKPDRQAKKSDKTVTKKLLWLKNQIFLLQKLMAFML